MRILFIGPSRIGDAVLCSGVLSHLTEAHPDARFTLAFGPVAAPLFADWPRLDAIIPMRKKPMAGHWFDLWAKTVGMRWDLVVDTRGSGLAYTLMAKRRAVYHRTATVQHKALEAAATLKLYPAPVPHLYVSDQRAVEAVRLMIPTLTASPSSLPEFVLRPATQAAAGGREATPILAIAPVANWVGKTWPAERFAALIPHLLARPELKDARVAILGAPEDRGPSAPIFAAVPEGRLIDLVGRTELLTLYACLKHVRLFVGNDSGLMHMAAAAHVPTLGLFGPSDARKYAPFGPHARYVRTPQDFSYFKALGVNLKMQDCFMVDLTPEAVMDAAGALLEATA